MGLPILWSPKRQKSWCQMLNLQWNNTSNIGLPWASGLPEKATDRQYQSVDWITIWAIPFRFKQLREGKRRVKVFNRWEEGSVGYSRDEKRTKEGEWGEAIEEEGVKSWGAYFGRRHASVWGWWLRYEKIIYKYSINYLIVFKLKVAKPPYDLLINLSVILDDVNRNPNNSKSDYTLLYCTLLYFLTFRNQVVYGIRPT